MRATICSHLPSSILSVVWSGMSEPAGCWGCWVLIVVMATLSFEPKAFIPLSSLPVRSSLIQLSATPFPGLLPGTLLALYHIYHIYHIAPKQTPGSIAEVSGASSSFLWAWSAEYLLRLSQLHSPPQPCQPSSYTQLKLPPPARSA